MSKYSVLIIGAGAVGVAMAASLASEGMEVAVLSASQTADAIEKNGVKRCGIFSEITIPADVVKVYRTYEEIKTGFNYVIISSKTMANAEIAAKLAANRNIMAENGKIVIFQNGWGNNDEYLKYFNKSEIYNARIITGFQRVTPENSKVTVHTAPILLGSLYGADNEVMAPLANAINLSGIPSEVSEDIGKALWAKMLFNTTLNPLGAILNVSYGELSESEHARMIMNSLIEETYAVLAAEKYETFWKTADEYKEVFYGKLVPDTYKHRSSTLQDIEKKQKTEIDTLNGCIIRLAKKNGIDVPTHNMIYKLIKAIEENMLTN